MRAIHIFCTTYYLFAKVNHHTVCWYALREYRYHHFLWFLIEFMPAVLHQEKIEQVRTGTWKKSLVHQVIEVLNRISP